MSDIHSFRHHAMATHYEVRLANQEQAYAAEAARAAFDLLDSLELQLSRFRADSVIARLVQLKPGEQMRLPEAVFDCLAISQEMELATHGAFSISATSLLTQCAQPQWSLDSRELSIQCERGRLQFDLGAIGKGFALDRMGSLLREWDCDAFLLVAGGSSILAGSPPPALTGWSCGLGEDNSSQRLFLQHASLSGSGLGVQGEHIVDPRTSGAAQRQHRAWALTSTAAESDALSTACMVLTDEEIADVLYARPLWQVFLDAEQSVRDLSSPFWRSDRRHQGEP